MKKTAIALVFVAALGTAACKPTTAGNASNGSTATTLNATADVNSSLASPSLDALNNDFNASLNSTVPAAPAAAPAAHGNSAH